MSRIKCKNCYGSFDVSKSSQTFMIFVDSAVSSINKIDHHHKSITEI